MHEELPLGSTAYFYFFYRWLILYKKTYGWSLTEVLVEKSLVLGRADITGQYKETSSM